MELFSEQIIGLKQIVYDKKDDDSNVLSTLKIFLLMCFVLSYLFIFAGFVLLPETEQSRCQAIGTINCYEGKELPISDPERYLELLRQNVSGSLTTAEQIEFETNHTIVTRFEELRDKEEDTINSVEQAELDIFLADLNAHRKLDDHILIIIGLYVFNGIIIVFALKYALNYHGFHLYPLQGIKKYPLYS